MLLIRSIVKGAIVLATPERRFAGQCNRMLHVCRGE